VKLAEALNSARAALTKNAIEDPLEAELLLRHALEIDRTKLYLDLEKELSPEDEKAFEALIARRLNGEPAAYITGHREFYGRDFHVNPRTLIPRPESELLVETALRLDKERQLHTIADIGTGCGAIAITLAIEIPKARIYATDISPAALEVARINCQRHGVNSISLLQGDMLEPLPEPVDLIVANLPYVERAEITPGNAEPAIALDGGVKGTEMTAKLCRQAKGRLSDDGTMLLEIGAGQAKAVSSLLHRLFPNGSIDIFNDLSGIERVVSLSLARAKVAG
jgi:release factor glutamine methyltransferase